MTDTTRAELDIDIHSPEYREKKTEWEADIRSKCPVAWTENYGGHWAISSYAGLGEGLRDKFNYTSELFFDEAGCPVGGGVTIPSSLEYQALPLETDLEHWKIYRDLITPVFGPRAIDALQPLIDKYATEVIDNMIEAGEADFVMQVASPATAMVSCEALGIPVEDWEFYAERIHQTFLGMPGDGSSEAGIPGMLNRLDATAKARRDNPGNELVDLLNNASVNGVPFTDKEIRDLLYGILIGGVDTTAGLLTGSVRYLADKPEIKKRMIEDEKYMRTATEELLRWISPAVGLAKTASRDFELEGQQIHEGDRLWFMYRAANWDPTEFENPETPNLERSPNRHYAFGTGIHRCVGSNLARAMFQTIIREFLIRIPDYEVIEDGIKQYDFAAVNAGYAHLPIRFTPGKRSNA